MEIDHNKSREFISVLVRRGLGIYGLSRMNSICIASDLTILDDDSVIFNHNNIEQILNNFMINFSKPNLIAKMTIVALAKEYSITVPVDVIRSQRKKSRFKRIFRR